jgi:signal transduction histidine kinase
MTRPEIHTEDLEHARPRGAAPDPPSARRFGVGNSGLANIVRPQTEALRYGACLVLLVVAYFAGAKVGLHLAYANRNVTAVWPPTGIAVASLLLLGLRLAPGVYLGAFLANLSNGASLETSLLISIGDTLAPMVAVLLVSRVARIHLDLVRVRDVAALLLLGGAVAMTVSATLGTASLVVSGALSRAGYWSVWRTYWIGDAIGVIIVAPLILSVAARSYRELDLRRWRWIEASALLAILIGASFAVFHTSVPVAYLLFPLAAWAAIRFRQFGAIVAIAAVSSISIALTVHGLGPFVAGLSTTGSLSTLQVFNGTLTLSALLLAALTIQARRAETRLRQNAADLEAHVHQRTAELEISLAQLQAAQDALVRSERLSAVGEMASVVGHELRNPLAAVINSLYLLRLKLGGAADPDYERHLEMAEREITKAATLAEDLTAFVRPRQSTPENVDVPVLVEEVLDATPPPPSVTIDLEVGPMMVMADRRQLAEVLINLITNAYQAIGGAGSVRIAATHNSEGFELSVEDNGPGIEDAHTSRVFEPFFTTKHEGTGLGLAIVQRLVQAQGGEVSVANRPEGGARFAVRFPTSPAPSAS